MMHLHEIEALEREARVLKNKVDDLLDAYPQTKKPAYSMPLELASDRLARIIADIVGAKTHIATWERLMYGG